MTTRRLTLAIAVMPLCILAGCALSENPANRKTAVPAAWHFAASGTPTRSDRVSDHWWTQFGSRELDRIVTQAVAQSYDVAAATARVRQAQAYARIAGAPLLPEVDAALSASRQGQLGGHAAVTGTALSAGFTASYEIDFWGGNRAVRDSALATLRATDYDRDTVRLTISAGAARLWLQTVGLRQRLAIAHLNRDNAAQVLKLVESQVRAGAATPLEQAQQRGLLAAQDRSIAAVDQQIGDSENSLSVLLGRHVGDLALDTASLESLKAPSIRAGLPSALLHRRPDIARAEADLAVADANILAARAAMLPALNLTAGVGYGSDHLITLLDNPLYSVAAALTAPIFNAGRLAAGRDLTVAQREELLAQYRSTIVSAFGDVERALNAIEGLDRQAEAQQQELSQARTAFTLAQARYKAGAETFLTVLDAQRTLYASMDLHAQLRQSRLQASVGLCKALGGGWALPPDSP